LNSDLLNRAGRDFKSLPEPFKEPLRGRVARLRFLLDEIASLSQTFPATLRLGGWGF
jgi:hypothetical protein